MSAQDLEDPEYPEYPDLCEAFNVCKLRKSILGQSIKKYTKNSSMFNKGLVAFMYNYYKDVLHYNDLQPSKFKLTDDFIEKQLTVVNGYSITIRFTCSLFMEAYKELAEMKRTEMEKQTKALTFHQNGKLKLYHGGDLFHGKEPKKKDSVRVLGFLSTAYASVVAQTFVGPSARYLYTISIPATFFPMCFGGCSVFPDEEEFLFPIGTQLVITEDIQSRGKSIENRLGKRDKEYKTFAVQCKAIPPTIDHVNALISMFSPDTAGGAVSPSELNVAKSAYTTKSSINNETSKLQVNSNVKTPSKEEYMTVVEQAYATVTKHNYMTVSEEDYIKLIDHITERKVTPSQQGGRSDSHIHILNRNRKILSYIKYKNELITLAQAIKLDNKEKAKETRKKIAKS